MTTSRSPSYYKQQPNIPKDLYEPNDSKCLVDKFSLSSSHLAQVKPIRHNNHHNTGLNLNKLLYDLSSKENMNHSYDQQDNNINQKTDNLTHYHNKSILEDGLSELAYNDNRINTIIASKRLSNCAKRPPLNTYNINERMNRTPPKRSQDGMKPHQKNAVQLLVEKIKLIMKRYFVAINEYGNAKFSQTLRLKKFLLDNKNFEKNSLLQQARKGYDEMEEKSRLNYQFYFNDKDAYNMNNSTLNEAYIPNKNKDIPEKSYIYNQNFFLQNRIIGDSDIKRNLHSNKLEKSVISPKNQILYRESFDKSSFLPNNPQLKLNIDLKRDPSVIKRIDTPDFIISPRGFKYKSRKLTQKHILSMRRPDIPIFLDGEVFDIFISNKNDIPPFSKKSKFGGKLLEPMMRESSMNFEGFSNKSCSPILTAMPLNHDLSNNYPKSVNSIVFQNQKLKSEDKLKTLKLSPKALGNKFNEGTNNFMAEMKNFITSINSKIDNSEKTQKIGMEDISKSTSERNPKALFLQKNTLNSPSIESLSSPKFFAALKNIENKALSQFHFPNDQLQKCSTVPILSLLEVNQNFANRTSNYSIETGNRLEFKSPSSRNINYRDAKIGLGSNPENNIILSSIKFLRGSLLNKSESTQLLQKNLNQILYRIKREAFDIVKKFAQNHKFSTKYEFEGKIKPKNLTPLLFESFSNLPITSKTTFGISQQQDKKKMNQNISPKFNVLLNNLCFDSVSASTKTKKINHMPNLYTDKLKKCTLIFEKKLYQNMSYCFFRLKKLSHDEGINLKQILAIDSSLKNSLGSLSSIHFMNKLDSKEDSQFDKVNFSSIKFEIENLKNYSTDSNFYSSELKDFTSNHKIDSNVGNLEGFDDMQKYMLPIPNQRHNNSLFPENDFNTRNYFYKNVLDDFDRTLCGPNESESMKNVSLATQSIPPSILEIDSRVEDSTPMRINNKKPNNNLDYNLGGYGDSNRNRESSCAPFLSTLGSYASVSEIKNHNKFGYVEEKSSTKYQSGQFTTKPNSNSMDEDYQSSENKAGLLEDYQQKQNIMSSIPFPSTKIHYLSNLSSHEESTQQQNLLSDSKKQATTNLLENQVIPINSNLLDGKILNSNRAPKVNIHGPFHSELVKQYNIDSTRKKEPSSSKSHIIPKSNHDIYSSVSKNNLKNIEISTFNACLSSQCSMPNITINNSANIPAIPKETSNKTMDNTISILSQVDISRIPKQNYNNTLNLSQEYTPQTKRTISDTKFSNEKKNINSGYNDNFSKNINFYYILDKIVNKKIRDNLFYGLKSIKSRLFGNRNLDGTLRSLEPSPISKRSQSPNLSTISKLQNMSYLNTQFEPSLRIKHVYQPDVNRTPSKNRKNSRRCLKNFNNQLEIFCKLEKIIGKHNKRNLIYSMKQILEYSRHRELPIIYNPYDMIRSSDLKILKSQRSNYHQGFVSTLMNTPKTEIPERSECGFFRECDSTECKNSKKDLINHHNSHSKKEYSPAIKSYKHQLVQTPIGKLDIINQQNQRIQDKFCVVFRILDAKFTILYLIFMVNLKNFVQLKKAENNLKRDLRFMYLINDMKHKKLRDAYKVIKEVVIKSSKRRAKYIHIFEEKINKLFKKRLNLAFGLIQKYIDDQNKELMTKKGKSLAWLLTKKRIADLKQNFDQWRKYAKMINLIQKGFYHLESRYMKLYEARMLQCMICIKKYPRLKKLMQLNLMELIKTFNHLKNYNLKFAFSQLRLKAHSSHVFQVEKLALLTRIIEKAIIQNQILMKSALNKLRDPSQDLVTWTKSYMTDYSPINGLNYTDDKLNLPKTLESTMKIKVNEQKSDICLKLQNSSPANKKKPEQAIKVLSKKLYDPLHSAFNSIISFSQETQELDIGSNYIVSDSGMNFHTNYCLDRMVEIFQNARRTQLIQAFKIIELDNISKRNHDGSYINLALKTVIIFENCKDRLRRFALNKLKITGRADEQKFIALNNIMTREYEKILKTSFDRLKDSTFGDSLCVVSIMGSSLEQLYETLDKILKKNKKCGFEVLCDHVNLELSMICRRDGSEYDISYIKNLISFLAKLKILLLKSKKFAFRSMKKNSSCGSSKLAQEKGIHALSTIMDKLLLKKKLTVLNNLNQNKSKNKRQTLIALMKKIIGRYLIQRKKLLKRSFLKWRIAKSKNAKAAMFRSQNTLMNFRLKKFFNDWRLMYIKKVNIKFKIRSGAKKFLALMNRKIILNYKYGFQDKTIQIESLIMENLLLHQKKSLSSEII